MKNCISLLFLLALTGVLCGCSRAIVFPESGNTAMTIPTVMDQYGYKMVDLRSNINRVVYKGFYIVNPEDSRFRIYIERNNSNYAEWLIYPKKAGFDFSCHGVREQQEDIYSSVHDLHLVYKQLWNKKRNTFSFKSEIVKWNGVDVIRFHEKGRNPQDGRLIYTDGFALPDPMEMDHIIEIKYIRCAYPNEIEKHGMKELGELFLKSVFIGDGR